MGKSQKKRLVEAHLRTMKNWIIIPYFTGNCNMLHIESR